VKLENYWLQNLLESGNLDYFTFEDMTDKLFRNFGRQLPTPNIDCTHIRNYPQMYQIALHPKALCSNRGHVGTKRRRSLEFQHTYTGS